jgi:Fe-S cluster assembly iron-binding protein IscA
MLRISQNTLQELRQEKISELTVRIISGGCAGSKIEVLTSLPEIMNDFKSFSIEGIDLYIPKDQQKELIG